MTHTDDVCDMISASTCKLNRRNLGKAYLLVADSTFLNLSDKLLQNILSHKTSKNVVYFFDSLLINSKNSTNMSNLSR